MKEEITEADAAVIQEKLEGMWLFGGARKETVQYISEGDPYKEYEWDGKLKYWESSGSFVYDQSIQLPADSNILTMLSKKENIIQFIKLNQTEEDDRSEAEKLFYDNFTESATAMKDVI